MSDVTGPLDFERGMRPRNKCLEEWHVGIQRKRSGSVSLHLHMHAHFAGVRN
jgi:hypothetical protein